MTKNERRDLPWALLLLMLIVVSFIWAKAQERPRSVLKTSQEFYAGLPDAGELRAGCERDYPDFGAEECFSRRAREAIERDSWMKDEMAR